MVKMAKSWQIFAKITKIVVKGLQQFTHQTVTFLSVGLHAFIL